MDGDWQHGRDQDVGVFISGVSAPQIVVRYARCPEGCSRGDYASCCQQRHRHGRRHIEGGTLVMDPLACSNFTDLAAANAVFVDATVTRSIRAGATSSRMAR